MTLTAANHRRLTVKVNHAKDELYDVQATLLTTGHGRSKAADDLQKALVAISQFQESLDELGP